MAKKKMNRKTARTRSTKKVASKGGRKAAKRTTRSGPAPVRTGGGAKASEVGRAVVIHFNAGRPDQELWAKWWHRDAESIEGEGVAMSWSGRKAIEAKSAEWLESHTVHGAAADGPYAGATGFAIKFRMDVEDKTTGERQVMEEIGVYTVQGGKVVREEFFYGPREAIAGAASGSRSEAMSM
jgi:hypothetical protein